MKKPTITMKVSATWKKNSYKEVRIGGEGGIENEKLSESKS